MGCGSSTQTKPTKSRDDNNIVISDVDIDDNFNESHKNRNVGNSSKQAPAASITVTPATTNKPQPSRPNPKKSTTTPVDEGIELEALDEEDYPPKPCRLKKTDIVPDVSMFKNIDDHVAKTPNSATASIPELATYLCRPAKNQLEKIRAIYQWVSKNIDYDVAGYLNLGGAQRKSCDPESVLRNRSSVCQGYADLVLSLCKEANVPAKTIAGYAKGYSHKTGDVISTKSDTNHAWNAVFVNNEWRLIDCTWDAGHVSDKKFQRHEGEFYFLTDPHVFVNDHFPYIKKDMVASLQWQLMSKPLDIEAYSKMVKVDKHAFKYDLELTSHKEAVLPVNKEAVIKFAARSKPLVKVGAYLTDSDGTRQDQCVLVQQEGKSSYCVTVRPQKPGKYTLQVFGNQGEENNLHCLFSFMVDCKTVDKASKPFPAHFGIWGANSNYADYGFDKGVAEISLFESDTGELAIRLPITEPVKALGHLAFSEDDKGDDQFVMLEQGQSDLVVHVRMDKSGYYKLQIFSQNKNGSSSYDMVMQYLVHCKKPLKDCQPFPHVFPGALEGRVTLIEPKTKFLSAETEVHFCLTSSIIDVARVGHTNFERGDNNTWNFDVITPASGENLNIFGRISDSEDKSYKALFTFDIE
ncbi:kyphoscoliosis peptidase-like [Argopecten irradians]|uniref:kyphoscoliosis peptidase-like n=1 Tax=Argopecten irradians TaxID=31199 RepID=UPI0037203C70